ncbi:MAG: protease pro-enzyme activation domain-containing protein [Solirubrobacteraceae bacterium]
MTRGWRQTVCWSRVTRVLVGAGSLLAVALGVGVADAGASSGSSRPGAGAGRVRVGSAAVIPRGARHRGALAADKTLRLTIALTPQDPAALTAFADAAATPGSPRYHHYVTVHQFAQRFGAAPADIASVQSALRAQGLSVGAPTANRLTLPVTGSVAQVDQAFSVSESVVQLPDGRTAYANDQAPQVDASVASNVQAVIGLDDIAVAQPQDLAHTAAGTGSGSGSSDATASVGSVGAGPPPCSSATGQTANGAYTADEIAGAYGLGSYYPSDEGAGQTVAVYEQQPYQTSDITRYERCYGITPAPAVTNVYVDQDPKDPITYAPGDNDDEAALDIEQVIGLAPKAAIKVFEGSSMESPAVILAQMASDQSVSVISDSWGQCEAYTPPSILTAENATLEEMAAQGQSFFDATGDFGSTSCFQSDTGNKTVSVVDPAAQPFATAVGGTSMGTWNGVSDSWSTPKDGSYPGETVWNSGAPTNNGSSQAAGSGGGVSMQWAMPSYQMNAANGAPGLGIIQSDSSNACGSQYCREVPDVSANADPRTGYAMYANGGQSGGGWTILGGTSAAAPLWAAFTALANASPACVGGPLGFLNPALYAIAASPAYSTNFNDITKDSPVTPGAGNDVFGGTNALNSGGLYPVQMGYDMATGLGTPIMNTLGNSLCTDLSGQPTITVANPGDQYTTAGDAASLPIQAVDSRPSDAPSYSATNLPAGLVINATTGLISGTPTTAGGVAVTVTVTDGSASGSVTFEWTVNPSTTTTTTPTPPTSTPTPTPTPTTTPTPTPRTPPVAPAPTSPAPPTPHPTPPHVGSPAITSVRVSGLSRGRPRLSFAAASGSNAPALASVTISLPAGMSFATAGKTLGRGIRVTSGSRRIRFTPRRVHGALTIGFAAAVGRAAVTVTGPAVRITALEATKVRRHKVRSLMMRMATTDTSHRTARFTVTLRTLS